MYTVIVRGFADILKRPEVRPSNSGSGSLLLSLLTIDVAMAVVAFVVLGRGPF